MAQIDQFDRLQQLGTGAYSTVSLVRRRGKSSAVLLPFLALKTIPRSKINSTVQANHVFAERAALNTLADCPYTVTLHDTFKDETNLYFLMECVGGGPLHVHLRGAGKFVESTAQFYAAEISFALEACHHHDIIYRDLKLSNVLLLKSGHIKLTDFGFAKVVPWGEKTMTYCGTPHAMAPEILLKQKYGREVDWWAFGVLLYEMMMGKPPTGYRIGALEENSILSGLANANFPPAVFGKDPQKDLPDQNAKTCICQCWSVDPTTRLGGTTAHGAAEIHAHPWMSNVVEDIRLGNITPPSPNPNHFSFEANDFNGEDTVSSSLTAQQQLLFADF